MQQAELEFDVSAAIKNEWLADVTERRRGQIIDDWARFIREQGGPHYAEWTDERLRAVEAEVMDRAVIRAFRTGDLASADEYIRGLVGGLVAEGLPLQEIERGILGLQAAVLRAVDEESPDIGRRLGAQQSATQLHDWAVLRISEVYDSLEAEQRTRVTALYELALALGQTLDMEAVLNMAVRKIGELTHATSVVVVLNGERGGPLRIAASYQMHPEIAETILGACRALGVSPERVKQLGPKEAACCVPDIATSDLLEPWQDLLSSHRCLSMACVPLLVGEHMLGDLIICVSEPHEFSSAEMDFFLGLAGQMAAAIQNASLFEEAKGKRELSLLLNAAKLFTSTLDLDDVLREVVRLAVDSVRADYSAVLLPNEPRSKLHLRAYDARTDMGRMAAKRALGFVEPVGLDVGRGVVGRAFTTGEALLIRNYAEFPGRIPGLAEALGPQSMLVAPARLKGRVVGVFLIGALRLGAFMEDDLSIVMGLADQAAVAIENARLYERERNIAETLEKSFLPASLPPMEGFDLAVRYRAALMEADVGGDFYDAFDVGAGEVVILAADVSGKGLEAATYMAMGKYTIRAFAAGNLSPGHVLQQANRVLYKNVPIGMFMTAWYAVLDVKEKALRYASAGHDQPMRYSRRLDSLTMLEPTGPGLAAVPDAEYGEAAIPLEPGDVLLVYTDGATDVKRDAERLGPDGLERAFRASLDAPAEAIAESILRAVLDYGQGRLADDVVLLVLKKQM